MRVEKKVSRLTKFLTYVLGHRPDEFGLVPDSHGYVKIKELIKAVCEEDGFRYVRRSHLNEIVVSMPDPPVILKDALIRAVNLDTLVPRTVAVNLPKLLFTCIRKRAYPVVLEKGILPAGRRHVILSSERQMAHRIGKRRDSKPVLLTVQVQPAEKKGVLFQQAGTLIYLAKAIPPGCYTGPPLGDAPAEQTKQETRTVKDSSTPNRRPEPGSFRWDPLAGEVSSDHQKGRKPGPGSHRRRDKAKKQKRKRPPWRS